MEIQHPQKITPYLWYDNQAREAANFYCSLFDNSQILSDNGTTVEFQLEGIKYIALNGGPQYQFNEAISLFVSCNNQEEVDGLWNQLTSDGGTEGQCGWCKDKFGLSWQIVPIRFIELMNAGTKEQVQKVIDAMMSMKKMIIEEFENAYKS